MDARGDAMLQAKAKRQRSAKRFDCLQICEISKWLRRHSSQRSLHEAGSGNAALAHGTCEQAVAWHLVDKHIAASHPSRTAKADQYSLGGQTCLDAPVQASLPAADRG